MTEPTLHALIDGTLMGRVRQDRSGRLSFEYDSSYQHGDIQIPLSLSMPLALQKHTDRVIAPWLWNLLPDNELVLERWGRRFGCSPRNAFALLSAVGEDCAGAVQFLTDERLENSPRPDAVAWLTEDEIGQRLAELRADAAAGRRRGDAGQFSLAGAQAKTAFYLNPDDPNQWGVPEGRLPTTHIFKPPIPGHEGHVENEHFCLSLARSLNLPTARSKVMEFAGERTIVVERYDRIVDNGTVYRLHQEDMCQALGIHPGNKYEKDGGPSAIQIMAGPLDQSNNPDLDRAYFMQALIFNFLIVGTDAHAKNYSMVIGAGGDALLAPFYDIASILPYVEHNRIGPDLRSTRLAMRIADKYRVADIMPRHWEVAAKKAGFPSDMTMGLLRHQISAIPDLLLNVAAGCRADGIHHPIIDRLVDLIAMRISALRLIYGAELAAETDGPAL
jgi:serine/threonine-protein kinase HipA